jgi:ABC-2 type transport system permease protein
MIDPATDPGHQPPRGPARTPSAFWSLYVLVLRTQATRARVASLLSLGALTVIVAIAIGASDPYDAPDAAAGFVNGLGLSLLVPVSALVFASAAFGDIVEDQTMVYLWLRPVRARLPVLAAWLASLTVALPVVLVPLVIAASAIDPGVALATAAAVTVGVVTYTAIFVALGIRVQRALVWGLAYILIWEGFVAQAGKSASRVAVRAYTRSILADLSDTDVDLGTITQPWAALIPLAVAAVGLAYAIRRFRTQDVA